MSKDRKKEEHITFAPIRKMENVDGQPYDSTSILNNNLLLHGKMQAKEADIRALAELSRALDKNALVTELKRMNDDVSEEYSLRDVDSFKKQYAAVLVQLDEVFN